MAAELVWFYVKSDEFSLFYCVNWIRGAGVLELPEQIVQI